jgi:hypothetical protein
MPHLIIMITLVIVCVVAVHLLATLELFSNVLYDLPICPTGPMLTQPVVFDQIASHTTDAWHQDVVNDPDNKNTRKVFNFLVMRVAICGLTYQNDAAEIKALFTSKERVSLFNVMPAASYGKWVMGNVVFAADPVVVDNVDCSSINTINRTIYTEIAPLIPAMYASYHQIIILPTGRNIIGGYGGKGRMLLAEDMLTNKRDLEAPMVVIIHEIAHGEKDIGHTDNDNGVADMTCLMAFQTSDSVFFTPPIANHLGISRPAFTTNGTQTQEFTLKSLSTSAVNYIYVTAGGGYFISFRSTTRYDKLQPTLYVHTLEQRPIRSKLKWQCPVTGQANCEITFPEVRVRLVRGSFDQSNRTIRVVVGPSTQRE